MQEHLGNGSYLFKLAQFLGAPTVFPPPAAGKLPIAVQFVIPGFIYEEKEKETIAQIAKKCGPDVWDTHLSHVEETRTKQKATLSTIAFYGTPIASEHPEGNQIIFQSRLLVERFLGLLSFFAGMKLSASNIQPTIMKNGQYSQFLPVTRRTSVPAARIEFPSSLESIVPTDDTFSALSWLRRGLAERDPVDTFSAFMVCLQIVARQIVDREPGQSTCPHCGAKLGTREPSITSRVRELAVSKLGVSEQLFDSIWKVRNAVTAHGNLPLTPEVLLRLTELKFEAAKLAFQGVKLTLGISLDSPPSLGQAFFITDAFMNVD